MSDVKEGKDHEVTFSVSPHTGAQEVSQFASQRLPRQWAEISSFFREGRSSDKNAY